MKTDVRLLAVIALLVSACTTGSMVTTRSYSDDAYYSPGDHPPVVANSVTPNQQQQRPSQTASGLQQDDAAKVVDNYFSDKKEVYPNSGMNNMPDNPDTTYEADFEAKNLISNYDEPEDVDYTTRIRTFYDPYVYDPYWDSFYSPGFGFGWGLGFGGFYGGFGYGFGGYYGGFYNPYFGWGLYNPFWGGSYRGYGLGYGGGYYGHGSYYGRRNYAGRMGSNAVGLSGTRSGLSSRVSGINSTGRTASGTSVNGVTKSASVNSLRQTGTRYTSGQNVTKSAGLNATNLRRTTVRNAVTSSAQRYTPTYSRPRTNIQSTYNSGTARQYSRPQSSGTATRSSLINSYQRGSSRSVGSVSNLKSGTVRSSGSSARSYSAPSRSSSGGNGGGGGGRSFSGGGGGGGGHRR